MDKKHPVRSLLGQRDIIIKIDNPVLNGTSCHPRLYDN